MWLKFQILGKWPFLNKFLNNLQRENDIGIDKKDMNLPGIPQWDKYDCLSFQAVSSCFKGRGVYHIKRGTFSFFSR